jgi:epoxyqueuosine reductase QueG
MNASIRKIVKSHLIPYDEYIFGFANLDGLLPEKYKGYPYGISIGRRLDDKIVDAVINGPTLEYLFSYEAINNKLQEVCDQITTDLKQAGVLAVPIPPTIHISSDKFDQYLPTLRYEVSHKMVATRAGLGWIGKTDLFISKKFGARLRLSSILIDHKIKPSAEPLEKSRCGKCKICVEKCPAQAANGQLWDITTDRDTFFDAFKCREKCSELARKHLNLDRRICGICISVCPGGQRSRSGNKTQNS